MSSLNYTGFTPSMLILIGIPVVESFHTWFAAALCTIYSVTLLGNCTLLVAIQTVQTLHKPMYLSISLLACSDLVLSSCILPKMLALFWFDAGEIHFSACLIQMFIIHSFAAIESSILSAMAFDRYVAVYNPLRYTSILTHSLIAKIAAVSLTRAVVLIFPLPLLTVRLPFCTRYVAHSFCEHIAVAKLSCADITVNNLYGLTVTVSIGIVDISCIALSYILILRAVLHLPHKKDRYKAFSTCGSHLCVMSTFYIPVLFSLGLHRLPHNIPLYIHIVVVNIYLLLPPLINPLIYGVKMKEIRHGVLQMFKRKRVRL